MTSTRTTEAAPSGEKAFTWWQQYCDPASGDPAVSARLRRCRSTAAAMRERAAIDLARRLGGLRADADRWFDRTLDLGRVLSHVRKNVPERPMRTLGYKSFPAGKPGNEAAPADRPALSEVRFRRLLETPVGEPLVAAFTRLVRSLGGEVNVRELSTDFLYWSDRTKKRWAFEYYAAAHAAPVDDHGFQETDA